MKTFLQLFKNGTDNFSSKRIMAWVIFGLFVYATIHGIQKGSTNEFIYGGLITLLTTVVGFASWERIKGSISETAAPSNGIPCTQCGKTICVCQSTN